jgi:hypothetical protein
VIGRDDDDDDSDEQLKRTSENVPFENMINKQVYEQRYVSSTPFL